MTNDLRYKFKKCEQDNATLSSTVNRLENQLARCKLAADQSERLEEELKLDKRKAQREVSLHFFSFIIFHVKIFFLFFFSYVKH